MLSELIKRILKSLNLYNLKTIRFLTDHKLILLVLYFLIKYKMKSKIRLYYNKNHRNNQLIEQCPSIHSKKFFPSFFIQSPTS